MSEISILPESLTNKIAAGEVIERPASIVRELIDNSVDAGAKTISLEVLYGGKKLIRVSDDGVGMDREDALLCFERHATSKIKSEDELFNITTLGFRGEALASIASVSKISLTTSTMSSGTGTKVEIRVNHKKEIADAPPLQGTIVEIRDIFYNTPARRKFLKSIPTELSHIIETVTQKALSCPEISFLLKHNDSEIINVSAAKDIKERFIQLYSEELFNEFLEINPSHIPSESSRTDLPFASANQTSLTRKGVRVKKVLSYQEGGVRLYGFVSAANFTRANRSHQFIFINRRPVKNPTISHAVYSAYRDLIPKDRHPAFFLFLDIDPKKVDVNVHPTKREVRFEFPEEVHKLVALAIREILHPRQEKSAGYIPSQTTEDKLYGEVVREALESALPSSENVQTDFFTDKIVSAIHRYFYIGESFVAEATNDGLTIIDQHAAHERVLYEKLLKKTSLEIENLFLPIRVELPAKEFNIIMNYKNLLHDFGLDIEEFGANNVIVRALPKEFYKSDMKGLLLDVASGILEEETIGIKDETMKQNLLRNIAARLACHKSVRGREPLNNEELSQLITDLEKAEVPDKCPHGRPTRVFFSLNDLRRMFKRK